MCLTVGAGFLCRGILSFFRDGYEARDCAPWHGGQEFGEKGEGPTVRENGDFASRAAVSLCLSGAASQDKVLRSPWQPFRTSR